METSDTAFTPFTAKTFYGVNKKQPRKRCSGCDEATEGKRLVKGSDAKFPNEFKSRILGPTVCWKTFYRQADAFYFAQNMAEDVCVFGYESCPDPTKPGTGQRRYLASSLPVFWHYYSQLNPSQRLHYEIIPEGAPCKMYFDLEYLTVFNPSCHGNKMVDTLIKYVCAWLRQIYGLDCDNMDVLHLDASTPNKFSRHLIFQKPGLVFENNVSQGNFVKCIFGILQDWSERLTNDNNIASPSYSQTLSSAPEMVYSHSISQQKEMISHHDKNVDSFGLINAGPYDSNVCAPQPPEIRYETPNSKNQTFDGTHQTPDYKHCDVFKNVSLTTTMTSWESFDHSSDDDLCLCSDTSVIITDVSDKRHHQQVSITTTCDINTIPRDDYDKVRDEVTVTAGQRSRRVSGTHGISDDVVNSVLSAFSAEELRSLFVKKKDDIDTLFCDLGVYTKNRNFRLYKSSKRNKNNHLLVSKENEFKSTTVDDKLNDDRDCLIFYASLITNVSLSSETKVLSFDDIKGSSKVPFTRNKQCVMGDKMGSGFICHEDTASLEGWGCTSPYPEIDQFITSLVSGHGKHGSVRHWVYWTQRQTLVYDIVGYRWCHNVQRQHKSNNIMYVVDIGQGVYHQKCHDPDCQAIKYRSQEMQLPSHVLPGFFLESDDFQEFPDPSTSKVSIDQTDDVGSDPEDDILLTAVEDMEMLQSLGELE